MRFLDAKFGIELSYICRDESNVLRDLQKD